MESENPYAHIKEFEEDKAKIWLNSLRPRSIRNWVDLQAEFLKKFFPTHRTNGLKRQISNFSAKENEKFMNVGKGIWRPSMLVLIMALIHGSCYVSEVSRGWDEPNSREMGRTKAPVNPKTQAHVMPCTICQSCDHVVDECPTMPAVREMLGDQANVVGQFRPNNNAPYGKPIIQAGETIQIFLGNQATSIPTTSPNPSTSTNLFSGASHCEPKWGVFKVEGGQSCDHLEEWKEVDQPLPKVRQDEELMSKRTLVKESNNQEEKSGKKNASKSSIEEEPRIVIKEDMMKKHMPPPFPQALHGKKEIKNSSEILEDLCTVKRGLHVTKNAFLTEQSTLEGHMWRSFTRLGASVNLLPYSVYKQLGLGGLKPTTITLSLADRNGVMQLTFGNMTLELNIFHLCKRHLHPEEEEGLEEGYLNPLMLAIMSPWRRREEILPLFNKEDSQGALEDPPKLVLKPLPVDLKYAYLEEDEKCPVVVSSTLTSDQEDSLLGVLRKCKKPLDGKFLI
ncbi:hypothetical protein CK203_116151 [Vitis vinifera]|uniref:Retrotransposon gag domain-containing protein n=1 Tax=Vitis vinifera TaxID=29760 RepID=A0A438DDL1_VITVI|nr:hypothetical protein CK203_116151 [Vitis vinifera]